MSCVHVLPRVLTVAFIGTLTAQAGAAIVLSDNLETNPVINSTPPAAANPNQPATAQSNSGTPTVPVYTGTQGFTVVSVESGTGVGFGNYVALDAAGQSAFNAGPGNTRGLHLFDGDATGGTSAPNVRYQFAALGSGVKVGPTAPLGSPNFTFAFDFNIGAGSDVAEGTNSPTNTFNAVVRLDNGASANAGPGLVIDRNEDGDIYTRTIGGNGALIAADLADNTWFRAVFTINALLSTYDVAIYDTNLTQVSVLTGSAGLGFEGNGDGTPNDITEFTQIFITDNNATGAGGDFYVDNLVVETVPEPASIALLALGALAMAGRGRRSAR